MNNWSSPRSVGPLLVLVIIVTSLSCSNREERTRALHEMERRQAQLAKTHAMIETLRTNLHNTIVDLEVAKDKLQQAKQYQFLRTASERESQVKVATRNILTLQKNTEIIETRIRVLSDSVFITSER